MNKEALTPVVTTVMLILLAIALGTAVMSWKGTDYEISAEKPVSETAFCNPMNELKIKYVSGNITEQEYLRIKQVIGES